MRPGAGPAPSRPLLDADEVGVERLVAVVHLDLDVRVRVGEVLAEARGVVGVGVGTHDDR